MRAIPKTIVGDLADWDLPALDDRICDLVEELAPKRIRLNVDEATFGDLLDGLLNDRLRVLAATAANERSAPRLFNFFDLGFFPELADHASREVSD